MKVADSPVKMNKVKKNPTGFRPRECIIHTAGGAKNDTFSAFTE